MTCKVIPLDSKREEREYEQLLLDLQEFIEAKLMAGEPIVVIIEKNVSFWERVKEKFNLRRV
jgi:hypothetical protein